MQKHKKQQKSWKTKLKIQKLCGKFLRNSSFEAYLCSQNISSFDTYFFHRFFFHFSRNKLLMFFELSPLLVIVKWVNGICLNRWLKNNWSKAAHRLILFMLSWIFLFDDKYVFGDICVLCNFWYFCCDFSDFCLLISWSDVTECIVYL